jgi:hypothetical protein
MIIYFANFFILPHPQAEEIGGTTSEYRKHYIIHQNGEDRLSLPTAKIRSGFHATFTGFRTQN